MLIHGALGALVYRAIHPWGHEMGVEARTDLVRAKIDVAVWESVEQLDQQRLGHHGVQVDEMARIGAQHLRHRAWLRRGSEIDRVEAQQKS